MCANFRVDHDEFRFLSGSAFATNCQWPTKENIEEGFSWLAKDSKPGDIAFVYYSGPSGSIGECDYLVPLYPNECIGRDSVREKLLDPMQRTGGVILRVLVDAPNCGKLFALPQWRLMCRRTYASVGGEMDVLENDDPQEYDPQQGLYARTYVLAKYKFHEYFECIKDILFYGDIVRANFVLLMGLIGAIVALIKYTNMLKDEFKNNTNQTCACENGGG